MNIVLFSDTYVPEINGIATSCYNLATTLRMHGENVLVVTTNPYSKEVDFGDGIIRVPGWNLKKLYGYRAAGIYNSKVAKAVRQFHPDVIHCQTDVGLGIMGMALARQLHVGVIYTFHTMIEDYAYYVTHGYFDRAARHIVRGFFRSKASFFDAIIAPSEKIFDYLRMLGSDVNIAIVPTGIDFERFSIEKEDKEETLELKRKFGIKPDDFVVLSLGRIAKEKSIDVLLRGYAEFLKKGEPRPTKFLIVGWGPAEAELHDLVHSLDIEDHVIFAGKVPPQETHKYYHLGDCFASASITETQGLTFMEAMSASLLTLARYDDNLVGTIKDGQTGFFFFSEEDFAEKLKKVMLLSQKEKARILKGAMEAIDIYSFERFYQNAMEVYTRVKRQNW